MSKIVKRTLKILESRMTYSSEFVGVHNLR